MAEVAGDRVGGARGGGDGSAKDKEPSRGLASWAKAAGHKAASVLGKLAIMSG